MNAEKALRCWTDCYDHTGLDVIIGWTKPLSRPVHHTYNDKDICNVCYHKFYRRFAPLVDHGAWFNDDCG